MDKSLREIAELVGGVVRGNSDLRISGLNGIRQAQPGELTFIGSHQYLKYLEETPATAILVPPDIISNTKALIQVKNPYFAFIRLIQEVSFEAKIQHPTGVHPTAVIGRNVKVGNNIALDAHVRIADNCVIADDVTLYAGVYIGEGCTVGQGTVMYPHVVLRERTQVGARCIIHAGVVLGSDGFGFAPLEGKWFKVPQTGIVIIGDDVEIGANSAVDRATFGSTVIGRGSKIDNLVQIGHNVTIGEDCVISGMTGVAGSATIGNHVTIAAQVGIADHAEIGDGVTIGARSGIVSSIKPGQVVSGFPAMDHNMELRVLAGMRRLPDIPRRIRELERRIQELEQQLHGKSKDNL
jgi:UDP-3-O-[3-hydroxymyristoyl] glucosamine N-acyltransferase